MLLIPIYIYYKKLYMNLNQSAVAQNIKLPTLRTDDATLYKCILIIFIILTISVWYKFLTLHNKLQNFICVYSYYIEEVTGKRRRWRTRRCRHDNVSVMFRGMGFMAFHAKPLLVLKEWLPNCIPYATMHWIIAFLLSIK